MTRANVILWLVLAACGDKNVAPREPSGWTGPPCVGIRPNGTRSTMMDIPARNPKLRCGEDSYSDGEIRLEEPLTGQATARWTGCGALHWVDGTLVREGKTLRLAATGSGWTWAITLEMQSECYGEGEMRATGPDGEEQVMKLTVTEHHHPTIN